jgi:uncharacterized protein DUF4265
MAIRKTSREVWFRIAKKPSGYPESMDWETLAAEPTENGLKLTSIPFYVRNVSWGDVISVADIENDVLEFSGILQRSGHSTLRLLLSENEAGHCEEIVEQLRQRGYLVDNDSETLLAISIPPSLVLSREIEYLQAERQKGRWEIEAGYLSS